MPVCVWSPPILMAGLEGAYQQFCHVASCIQQRQPELLLGVNIEGGSVSCPMIAGVEHQQH